MDLFWLGPQPGTLAEHFFCHVVDVAKMCGTPLWLHGGYALDVFLGRRLKEHKDIDLLVMAADWPTLAATLAHPEYRFVTTGPGTRQISMEETHVADVLLIEQHPDGFVFVPAPRGGAPLPPGSLDDGRIVRMWNRIVQTVTLECLYVLKAGEGFEDAAGPNSVPRREEDLALIRNHLPAGKIEELEQYCRLAPLPPPPTPEGDAGGMEGPA